jgi:hypothetical protein
MITVLALYCPLKDPSHGRVTSHPAVDAGYPDIGGVGECVYYHARPDFSSDMGLPVGIHFFSKISKDFLKDLINITINR